MFEPLRETNGAAAWEEPARAIQALYLAHDVVQAARMLGTSIDTAPAPRSAPHSEPQALDDPGPIVGVDAVDLEAPTTAVRDTQECE